MSLDPTSKRARDAFVLLACAAAIALGVSAKTSSTSKKNAAPTASGDVSALPPPPLPPGADLPSLPAEMSDAASCSFSDRGYGDYERFRPLPLGRVLVPTGHGVDGDGSFDLLIHFHGSDAVRKMLAPEPLDLVIAAVDAGVGSSRYSKAFADPQSFSAMLRSIEKEVADAVGVPAAKARHIALSSWSAGYGATGQILLQESTSNQKSRVSAVVLLDSLYASYIPAENRIAGPSLAPFLERADRATRGEGVFFLSYTEIATYGYASTSEVAGYLTEKLGVEQQAVDTGERNENALTLRHVAERGRLFVQGYAGTRKEDHCAQLRLLPRILYEQVLPFFLSAKP